MIATLDVTTQISGFWKLKLAQCASISVFPEIDFVSWPGKPQASAKAG
jgi:hypothetical protein